MSNATTAMAASGNYGALDLPSAGATQVEPDVSGLGVFHPPSAMLLGLDEGDHSIGGVSDASSAAQVDSPLLSDPEGSATGRASSGTDVQGWSKPLQGLGLGDPGSAAPSVDDARAILLRGSSNDAEKPYPAGVLKRISKMSDYINAYADRYKVPRLAVAGAIANEYDTRSQMHGLKGLLDEIQDREVPQTASEPSLRATEFGNGNYALAGIVPSHVDSPGFLRADIGAGNFGMRTAEYLFDRYRNEFPSWVEDHSSLAKYAVSDEGNAHLAAMYMSDGRDRLSPLLSRSAVPLPDDYKTALYIDYYRKGPETLIDNYASRVGQRKAHEYFAQRQPSIPLGDLPLPDDGVRAVNNASALNRALRKPR